MHKNFLDYKNMSELSLGELIEQFKPHSREAPIENSGKQVTIPKIIFQTWKTKEIPEHWKPSVASIKKYMPSWQYVLMTDENNRDFVKDYFPDFLSFYDAFPYNIQRCDSVRYLLLYSFGGLYMDLDIELMKPLDDLFTNDSEVFLINSTNITSVITNSFMASKKGSKLWLDVLAAMKEPVSAWASMTKHTLVLSSTGPNLLNRVAKTSKTSYTIIPSLITPGCNVCSIKPCGVEGDYIKVLEGSSWIGIDSEIFLFCMCNGEGLIIFAILFFILFIVYVAFIRYI